MAAQSLLEYGRLVLRTADSAAKSELTLEAFRRYHAGEVPVRPAEGAGLPPLEDAPARPAHLRVVAPRDAPSRGKGGSLAKRVAMVHSLAHIESFAIDLSWDILVRFAGGDAAARGVALPDEFFEDWLKVAEDEARHFAMWAGRLAELESSYGALPVHNGLWQSAEETKDDLLARLAVVHMVHEAHGLDVEPKTMARFKSAGDKRSAELLASIYVDEITHVGFGLKWFKHVAAAMDPPSEPVPLFHELVRRHFRGLLKAPFNVEARDSVGLTGEWYLPLTRRAGDPEEEAVASAEAAADA